MASTMPGRQGPVAIIVNAGSGTGGAEAARNRIEEVVRSTGRRAIISVIGADGDIDRAVGSARREGAVVIAAGGGDGTVNAVAAQLVGNAIPLGVLPLGTLNHFARDVGIPLELDAAIEVILAGRTRMVDVGEVNQRIFLNNSSLGLYPAIVRLRESRPARGVMKWIVATGATLKALQYNRILSVELKVDGQTLSRETPIVFVGNNEYKMKGFEAGTRETLDQGMLALYVVNAVGRAGQLKLAWRVFRGTAEEGDELDVIRTTAVTVRSRHPRLHVSLDGEVVVMPSPIAYRIRPGALRVCVP